MSQNDPPNEPGTTGQNLTGTGQKSVGETWGRQGQLKKIRHDLLCAVELSNRDQHRMSVEQQITTLMTAVADLCAVLAEDAP